MHSAAGDSWSGLWPILVGGLAAAVFFGSGCWKLRRVPIRAWQFGPAVGLTTFVIAIIAGMLMSSLAMAVLGEDTTQEMSMASMLTILLAAWCGQAMAVACLPLVRSGFGPTDRPNQRGIAPRGSSVPDRRWGRMPAVFVGLLGLLMFWPMTLAAATLGGLVWEAWYGQAPDPMAHDLLRQIVGESNQMDRITLMVIIAIVPAIIEEVLYRGLLQESIRRARRFSGGSAWYAIIGSSLIFT